MAQGLDHGPMIARQNHDPTTVAFARAFMRSLTQQQRDRLSQIVVDMAPVLDRDLRDVPALDHFLPNAPPVALPAAIADILRPLLTQDPAHPADRAVVFDTHPFVAITQGAGAAASVVAQLPETLVTENLRLGLFKTVEALKSGNLAKADALMAVLSDHFDIPALEHCGAGEDPELSCVLFMKAIYSDKEISDLATERLFGVLASLPKEASLLRAILYNVSLDVFLRRQKMSEAEGAAHRAVFHYTAAGEHGVTFYVHLYLAVIALWQGELVHAQDRVHDARAALADFQGAVDNDHLLLRSFEMIVTYETGDPSPLTDHLLGQSDTIPYGELWPSIAGPIISYGRRALAQNVTPAAALSWVRQWRVRQRRSHRFDTLISVQEALALQDLGRWQEADEILTNIDVAETITGRIAELSSLLDRRPKAAELAQQIGACLEAPDLSARQRLVLRLMAVQSALARGIEREAARHLGDAIGDVDPTRLPAIWAENRKRVASILGKRELRAELRRFPKLRRQIQALVQVDAPQKPAALTDQEFRVLGLLAEAQSNKAIGLRLGISLPTVKFHVTNLFRKTQASNRRAVVKAAIEAGWLPDV